MVEINMVTNVSVYLNSILFLFPNLTHFTLNKPLNTAKPETVTNMSLFLSDFKNQTRLTLKDVHFDPVTPFLGKRLLKYFVVRQKQFHEKNYVNFQGN